MGMGAKALILERPVLPMGTQILENSRAATMRGICPATSR
jgi:hypothetical protein